jgi:hypothetical protein
MIWGLELGREGVKYSAFCGAAEWACGRGAASGRRKTAKCIDMVYSLNDFREARNRTPCFPPHSGKCDH